MAKNTMDLSFLEDLSAILEVDPRELNENYELHNDNWNSLSIVSTIVLLDEHFGITIPAEKLRLCTSVGQLWEMIQEALAEKGKWSK